MNSSQIQALIQRQTTPPRSIQNTLIYTLKSSRQIYQISQSIRTQELENSTRNTYLFQVLRKAGEAIDNLNITQVSLTTQNIQLKAQVEALSTKKRKRITPNPNTQFANIDNIIIAKEAQALLEAQLAAKQPIFDAEQVSKVLQEKSIQELQFEWQLDSY